MCYLIAKEFDKRGCIAVKTRHGKALADFTEKLQKQIGENGVQLVTISRPSAYGEYEPYEILESKEEFRARVLSLVEGNEINHMKTPQMILFDYGQTLIAEQRFDGIKGTAAVLQHATL